MKKRLAGKILTSLLVVLMGVNTLMLPIAHAKTPNPQAKANTKKPLSTLTVKELLPLAQAGNADAQFFLGLTYQAGKGVTKDDQKALYWFQKSAEQSNADAQRNLAVILSVYGENLPQDIQKAYVWASLAAAQGEQKASELRDRIAKQLTSKQLTEAQEWAENWHQKIQHQ